MLAGLRKEGVTILLVEQNAARAVEFADRTYVLRSRRPVAVHGHARGAAGRRTSRRAYSRLGEEAGDRATVCPVR